MIKIDVALPLFYNSEDITSAVTATIPVAKEEIREMRIVRRTLVLDDKSDIHYKASVAIAFSEDRERGLLKMRKRVSEYPDYSLKLPVSHLSSRPVVCGFGPAGMFSALALAEAGARPIVIERGLDIDARDKTVSTFSKLGILDTECNVQYGEGGAGSYSDGKLKVGSMDKYKMYILKTLVDMGANEEILFSTTSHVGTDVLGSVVKKIRERIISLGGEVRFGTRLARVNLKDGRVFSVTAVSDDTEYDIEGETLVMATGHSARDSFEALISAGAQLLQRPFGVGMRIEHLASDIDSAMYGKLAGNPALGHAEYTLSHNTKERGVYTFCMCPGGEVVAATSEEGGVVVNGMSVHSRDGKNSNSAVVCSIFKDDYGADPMKAIEFQRKIERAAFRSGGGDYSAPMITFGDFSNGKLLHEPSRVLPSYMDGGVKLASPYDYLPPLVCDSIKNAIFAFDKKISGFACRDAILTGAETRTSAPLRILRDNDTRLALGYENLYPAGEGAGYAGGITSAAIDGIRTSLAIMKKYKAFKRG